MAPPATQQNVLRCLGFNYEVHIPAYFALLLNGNPDIEDFKLRSNVQDFGNLGDLLVDIKTRSGENLYFAFQLKHKEKSNKNILSNFEATRRHIKLEKYCEAFKQLNKENRDKYHFILYTNNNFDSSHTNEIHKFHMKQDKCCLGRNVFDTSGDDKHLYKFEVNGETGDDINGNKEDFREFFSKFCLYTGQANKIDLEKSILDIIKYKECYVKYIDFFRRWHRGDYTNKIIDKKALNVHLVDIFLSSVAIDYYLSDGQDSNSNFFEEMVQQFDITIIDASMKDFIKQLKENVHKYPEKFNKAEEMIRLAKDNKFIDRFSNELNEKTKLKLLHYFFQKPLILDFHESSKALIYEASKLCRIHENGIKFIILGQDIDISKFSGLKIFTKLSEVKGILLEQTKKRCNLSLQGRNISLKDIFEEEIHGFITPKEIFHMLKGNFTIGEDKEKLPECYIPKTVSTTVFDIESIIKHSSGSTAIIFYYEGKFEALKILIQKIVDREIYLCEYSPDAIIFRTIEFSKQQLNKDKPIIILKKECSRNQLDDDICKQAGKDGVHLFKVIDEKRCLLLMSTNNIAFNRDYKYTKMTIEEDNIHILFNNSINILCAQPGMGKSTLMKYLKNECDPIFWTLKVDLKAHNQFFKENRKIEDILKYFLELEKCQDLFLLHIKKMFLRKQKIAFFLDALDEIEDECIDYVLNITRQLSEMGFRVWLSSRQNLQPKLEQYFNIFAIEINELNEDQQKNYIESRLTSLYNKNEIEEIVEKIFSNTNLANNRQIVEIPLQLQIITQIFIDDKSHYSKLTKNNFILTKMFEIFFQGKYKHYLAKIELKHNHFLGELEEKFENYEIVALHSVLDDEHFEKLQIEKLELTQIKNWDFLNILIEINSENKVVFEHFAYAAYFAAKFFVKNLDKARILKEEIFSEKYQKLRIIFNIMLAEDSPLHLAIIYKDLGRVQELHESSLVDKGGRNFLQIAACVATRHPPLESHPESNFSSECLVKDFPVQHFKGEDSKIKEIVNLVLSSSNPFNNDKIFDWNSLDYALVNGALYIVEAILEKYGKPEGKPFNFHEKLRKYYSDEVVAYYSIRFGYYRLLSEIIAKNSIHVTGIVSAYLREENNSILHFLFNASHYTNKTRIVELLTGDDINKIVCGGYKAGYTLLHLVVFYEDIEILHFLLQQKADVNIKDKEGRSPLFWAVQRNNLEISKLLVENGADINIEDKNGKSPLFWAIKQKNLEISKLLVENGADVDDKNGKSPLYLPVKQKNPRIAKLLVENGADVDVKDKNGKSPLYLSVKQKNPRIAKLLVENGADVNIERIYGWLPPFWAFKQKNLEFSKLLVENGADINIEDKNGKSPLYLAVKQKNPRIAKFLVENGADINIKGEDGWSPLSWAVEQNNLELLKLLVENGADVNIQDKDGWSPLFCAAKNSSHVEILKLLIEKGADVNIKNIGGESPLFWAIERNKLEISKLLIENEADVNIKNIGGESPLFWAVERNNFEISKLLIKKGADVNIKNKYGKSPLLLAVKQNNFKILKLLIKNGADVNITDKDGRSALFWAVKKNSFKITEFLVQKGTDDVDIIIDKEDKRSPLCWAVYRNNFEIAKLLVEKGANVNIKDKNGKSPLFWALKQNNREISKLLFKSGAEVNSEIMDMFYSLLLEK